MLKKSIVLAFLVALGACSQETVQPASTSTRDTTVAPAASKEQPEIDLGYDYRPLPDGVGIEAPFVVRNDRIYVTKAGDERRRTSLEILEGDSTRLAEAAVGQLEAQGFSRMQIPERGDGVLRMAVRKKGVGRINVTANPDVGNNPSHPRSVGVISFDWPSAAAQAGAQAPEAVAAEAEPVDNA